MSWLWNLSPHFPHCHALSGSWASCSRWHLTPRPVKILPTTVKSRARTNFPGLENWERGRRRPSDQSASVPPAEAACPHRVKCNLEFRNHIIHRRCKYSHFCDTSNVLRLCTSERITRFNITFFGGSTYISTPVLNRVTMTPNNVNCKC